MKVLPLVLVAMLGGVAYLALSGEQRGSNTKGGDVLTGLRATHDETGGSKRELGFDAEDTLVAEQRSQKSLPAAASPPPPPAAGVYSFSADTIDGAPVTFGKYAGLVTIVVNVASF